MSEPKKDSVDATGVFFPRTGSHPAPPPSLERALYREVHKTDLLRTRLLAAMLGLFLLGFLVMRYALLKDMPIGQSLMIIGTLTVAIVLELSTAGKIRESMEAGAERPPILTRYMLATLEVSVISVVLLVGAKDHIGYLTSPIAFLYFFFIIASTLYLEFPLAFFTGFMCAVQFGLVSVFAIENARDILAPEDLAFLEKEFPALMYMNPTFAKSVAFLLCGILAGVVSREVRSAARTALEKHERMKDVRAMFGRFVSPEVATQVLDGGGGKGETREVCVMFVDIRNFTSFSESRTPSEVVEYLNQLFDHLVNVVRQHGGCVSKFLGDGFMAVFGAPLQDPDACKHALDCARQLLAKVEELNGTNMPMTRIGIGLHTGTVVAGEVGAEERKEYTVIGDAVNLASRIEGMNKEFGSNLLASEEVLTAAGILTPPEGSVPRGPMPVKGRTAPVRIVQLA